MIMWMSVSLTLCLNTLVLQTAMLRWAGASQQDLLESYEFASLPLGLINSWFVIRPGTAPLHVCFILIANSYFYSLLLVPVTKFVRYRLATNRTLRLDLDSHKDLTEHKDQQDDNLDL